MPKLIIACFTSGIAFFTALNTLYLSSIERNLIDVATHLKNNKRNAKEILHPAPAVRGEP